MAGQTPTLEHLGAKVAELSKEVSAQLKAAHHPEPSFAADGPAALPADPKISLPRLQLVEALMDMLHLARGPKEYLLEESFSLHHDPFVLNALNQFDFFGAVPLAGSASYADVARHTRLPETVVRRLLRYAFQNHIFAEDGADPDRVVHTATSAQFLREPLLRTLVGYQLEEAHPMAMQGVQMHKNWFVGTTEATEEIEHNAWGLTVIDGEPVNGEPYWTWADKSTAPGKEKGWRTTRFAEAMQGIAKGFAVPYEVVLEMYDWDALGEATVVDVGGSAGHVSALIAHKHPKLKFIVQDLPRVEPAFAAHFAGPEAALAPRFAFEAHDFFTPQTTTTAAAADVFLVKSVLHDWPDKYAARILASLVLALASGGRQQGTGTAPAPARVLVFDIIMPPARDAEGRPTLPRSLRKMFYSIDLQMHVGSNARERTVDDWVAVAKRADDRFELRNVFAVPGQPLGIMEFVLKE